MKKLWTILAGLVLVTGCGVGRVSTGDNGPDEIDDELSTRSASFVTVQLDTRRCASPYCGGYFVADANRNTAAQYVTGLDFSLSSLDAANQQKVLSAPAGELLLKGKLGAKNRHTGLRAFKVVEAYRGMPGIALTGGETFYAVSDRSPARNCFTAPCNNELAQPLNGSAKTDFTTLSVQSAAVGFVDTSWLDHRVHQGRALVAGSLVTGQHFPGGDEQVLDASQVFVQLPELAGPCPMMMQPYCGATGQINAYTRNDDRCVVPAGCVDQGICPMFVPACSAGYTLSSYVGTSGCSSYTCDPTWIVQ